MPVRTKTLRRLRKIGTISVVILCLGTALYALRKHQIAQRILHSRDEGYAALAAGDYFEAMHKIGPFLQRNPGDPQALFSYAQARRQVHEANDKHLAEAMALLRRALELRPDFPAARAQLLDLYVQVGFNTEILSVAAKAPQDDADVLRAASIALARLGRWDDALAASQKYDQQRPLDLEHHVFTLDVIMHQQPGAEGANRVIQRATELRQQHPDDARFELLQGVAHAMVHQPDEALEWLQRAAAHPAADANFVATLSWNLDRLGQFEQSLALLQRQSQMSGDVQFERAIAHRLYQAGQFEQLSQRLANLGPADPAADVELLALRAMALMELEGPADARPIVQALRQRRDGVAGRLWGDALEAIFAAQPSDKQLISTCSAALRFDADNPYLRYQLGCAYGRLGEYDAAINQLQRAMQWAPAWPAPPAEMARLFAVVGLPQQAAALNQQAQRRFAGQTPVASASSPVETAFEQASAALQTSGLDAAMHVLDAAAAEHADNAAWRLSRVRLLELAGDSRAAGEWVSLGDAFPNDGTIQRLALQATFVQADRAFRRRTIDRLAAIVGDDGVMWRLADAQWLMEDNTDARPANLAKAATILSNVSRKMPDALRVRLMLADCMLKLGQEPEAIDQLSAAARIDPQSNTVALRLAGLLQSRGSYDEARPHLQCVEASLKANPAAASADVLRTLAELYAQQGESAQAIAILDEVEKSPQETLQLAALYRSTGRLTEQMCGTVLALPSSDAIAFVADYYAEQGRHNDAEQLLSRLDVLELGPGTKELAWAEYHQRRGDGPRAVEQLNAATHAAPKNVATWHALILHHVAAGQIEPALAACHGASHHVPDDAAVKILEQNAAVVAAVGALPPARDLIRAIVEDPQHAAAATEALQAMHAGVQADETAAAVAQRLAPIAQRNPRLLPLQNLLASLHASTGNFDDALAAATQAMRMFPTAPEPAQLAVQALAGAGRWPQVVATARQWRARLGGTPLPADLVLAAAFVELKDPAAAQRQLEPYLAAAMAEPAANLPVVAAWMQAKTAAGDFNAASQLLWRIEPKIQPAAAAQLWLPLAMMQEQIDAAAVHATYRHILTLQADEPIAQNNLAMLLMSAGDVGQARQLASSAATHADHPLHAVFLDTLSRVHAKQGDYDGAVAALDAAVKAEPQNLKWRVNLLQLLVANQRFTQARTVLDETEQVVSKSSAVDDLTVRRLNLLKAAVQ